jgi:D-alanyl-lipoteichoic acid acyltransferase DltB (MBOAT superfamily)
VYKRKIEPTHDVVAFFAFISFFPQLVAGPIERATNLLPQFYCSRTFDYTKAVDGCRQMLWGFFKKMVVADNCATAVNLIWNDYSNKSGFELLIGGVLFTFQIYGDFSGYSDIAIGTARLFGFNLMCNFRYPYFSRDIAEFWRRWHISLTTWFRDYIYIPLGGSRCAKWKVMRNTLIIFLVSGFWHGANWTFIVWGAYHAILFFPLMLFGLNRKYTGEVAAGRLLPSAKEFFQMLSTFVLVVIGWIIFRSETIGQALDYLGQLFSLSLLHISLPYGKKALFFVFVMMLLEWFSRETDFPMHDLSDKIFKYRWMRIMLYYILIMVTLIAAGSQETFIYFQF